MGAVCPSRKTPTESGGRQPFLPEDCQTRISDHLVGHWTSASGERYFIQPSGLLHSSLGYCATVEEHGSELILNIPEWPGLGDKIPLEVNDKGNLIITSWNYELTKNKDQVCVDTHGTKSIATMHRMVSDQIRKGRIKLIRGSYFEDCKARGVCFEMRTKIPEQWMWDPEEALQLWDKYRRLFLVVISYGWLSAPHSDPDGFHLHRLACIIGKLKRYVRSQGLNDIALAVDFCSLWQNEHTDTLGCDSRTAEQQEDFKFGIAGFNVLYLHRDVTVLKLASVPAGTKRGYYDRGWAMTESTIIGGKSGVFFNRLEFDDTFDPDQEEAEGIQFIKKHRLRKSFPPLLPDDFEALIERMSAAAKEKDVALFTDGKDIKTTHRIYSEMFALMHDADNLIYDDQFWGLEEATKLAAVLKGHKVRSLTIENSAFGDEGMGVILEALCGSENLRFLLLNNLSLGEGAAAKICDAIRYLPTLFRLNLRRNSFTPEETQQIQAAWAAFGKQPALLAM